MKSIAFNHDGSLIATCSRDKTIWLWERDEDDDFSCQAVLSGHSQDVKFVKFAPGEQNLLYSASYDDSIKCWRHEASIDDWICCATLNGHSSTVWQFDISGDLIASCSQDQSVIIWKENKELYRTQNVHERAIYSISWHGDLLATAGADNILKLHRVDRATGKLETLHEVTAHTCDVNAVQFSPDGSHVATCSDDTTVKLWKITAI